MKMDRGRLVITDAIYVAIALFALSGLWPVFMKLVEKNEQAMGPELSLYFGAIGSFMIVTLLASIILKAMVEPQ